MRRWRQFPKYHQGSENTARMVILANSKKIINGGGKQGVKTQHVKCPLSRTRLFLQSHQYRLVVPNQQNTLTSPEELPKKTNTIRLLETQPGGPAWPGTCFCRCSEPGPPALRAPGCDSARGWKLFAPRPSLLCQVFSQP